MEKFLLAFLGMLSVSIAVIRWLSANDLDPAIFLVGIILPIVSGIILFSLIYWGRKV